MKNVGEKEGPERLLKRFLPTITSLPTPSPPHANYPNSRLTSTAPRPRLIRVVVKAGGARAVGGW